MPVQNLKKDWVTLWGIYYINYEQTSNILVPLLWQFFSIYFSTYLRRISLLDSKHSTELQGESIVRFLHDESIGHKKVKARYPFIRFSVKK